MPTMNNVPRIYTEIALTTRPTEVASWEDVSAYAGAPLAIRRGRENLLDRYMAGTLSVVLDNSSRIFDPTFTGGAYYGDLKVRRRIRISALWDNWIYPLFTGYINAWPPTYSLGQYRMDISAVDGFSILNLAKISGSYPEELSSDRVNRVLDDIGWTTGNAWVLDSATNSQLGSSTILAPTLGDRFVMIGNTTCPAENFTTKVSALGHLQDVEKAEGGRFFMGMDGSVHFYDRLYLLSPTFRQIRAIFGDGGSLPDYDDELPFIDFEPIYDDQMLYNEVSCSRKDGTAQSVSDTTSKLDYYPITLEEENLLSISDDEMLNRAQWILSRQKDPQWHVKSITIDPLIDPDRLWPVVLSAEFGDHIRVRVRPTVNGVAPIPAAPITADYRIENITLDIDEDQRWKVKWGLSPADPTMYWHMSDGSDGYAAYSVLGETTVLAY